MEVVLPTLVTLLVVVVLFRRQIKRASRRWFGGEPVKQKETLADVLARKRQKLNDQKRRQNETNAESGDAV